MRSRHLIASVAIVAFSTACSAPVEQPAVRRKPAPAKTATISPEVAALMKPDPDVDRKLSPEEIKATLAAAQQRAPRPEPPSLPGRGDSQWQRMEGDQKAKLDQFEKQLATTTVYVGPDGQYHTSGCSSLMAPQRDMGTGQFRMAFVGHQITLAYARDQHLSGHSACGAPSYQYSYSQP